MPNSLRCRIKKWCYQGVFNEKDRDRLINGLDCADALDKIRAEIEKAVWEDTIICLDGSEEVRIPRLDPDDVFEIIDKHIAGKEQEQ